MMHPIKHLSFKYPIKIFVFIMIVYGLLYLNNAHAALFEQLAVSTKAISLSNTVTADPPGLMSVHYNPAGLSHFGEGSYVNFMVVAGYLEKTIKLKQDENFDGFMEIKDDPLAGKEGTTRDLYIYVPFLGPITTPGGPASGGLTFRSPGSDITLAYAYYLPFGGGLINKDENDPGRFAGKSLYLQHLVYAAPAISYQVNSKFSVGLTVAMGQTALGVKTDARAPSDMIALTKVVADATDIQDLPFVGEFIPLPMFGGGVGPYETVAGAKMNLRDEFSPSYNIGALWEPNDFFSFGLCYQSPIKAQLEGNYKLTYSEQMRKVIDWLGSTSLLRAMAEVLSIPSQSVPEQTGRILYKDLEFPQRVQFGVKVRPIKQLKLLADLHWSNWSVMKDNTLIFDQDIQLLQLVRLLGYQEGFRTLTVERKMKDTWHWSIGSEVELKDWLCLRLGYEQRKTSVQHHLYDPMVPLPDLDIYGAGMGIHLKNDVEVDFALAYAVNKGYKVKNNGSTHLNSTYFADVVYNPYSGLHYEQDFFALLGSFTVTMPIDYLVDILDYAFKKVGISLFD
ncbi:MAG: outer membrane protein transport protein [Desulfobacterales bacterium]|nr:outer membrane protein transport protein [Desulfobacterales bacterium]